jgi:hypothetical protein
VTHRDFPKNSARDVPASGRTSQLGRSVAAPNVPDRAEALEAADNGRRQELAMWNEIAAIGQRITPEPLDPELQRVLSMDLSRMRELGIEAMKLSDANREQEGMAEMHVRAGQLVNEIDEMAALLRRLES